MNKLQPPASDAGPPRVNIGQVAKAARKDGGNRRAMTGVPGSGPVGSDSRPGSFHQALNEVKSATPDTLGGILKDTNRTVRRSSGRTIKNSLTLDANGPGPNSSGKLTRSDPVQPNDMHHAIKKMMMGSAKPDIVAAAHRIFK